MVFPAPFVAPTTTNRQHDGGADHAVDVVVSGSSLADAGIVLVVDDLPSRWIQSIANSSGSSNSSSG